VKLANGIEDEQVREVVQAFLMLRGMDAARKVAQNRVNKLSQEALAKCVEWLKENGYGQRTS
jgi:type III secretory pathway lipoprotein EscJ